MADPDGNVTVSLGAKGVVELELISSGDRPLYAYTTNDYWIDLGKPEAYLASHRHIFDGAMPMELGSVIGGPGAKGIPSSAVVPPVYVGRDVKVAPDAKVGPYTVLGDGCRIDGGAVVSDSLLWDGVIVEAGAVVETSIIASRAHVGAGAVAYAGSRIGHDADISARLLLEETARVAAG